MVMEICFECSNEKNGYCYKLERYLTQSSNSFYDGEQPEEECYFLMIIVKEVKGKFPEIVLLIL